MEDEKKVKIIIHLAKPIKVLDKLKKKLCNKRLNSKRGAHTCPKVVCNDFWLQNSKVSTNSKRPVTLSSKRLLQLIPAEYAVIPPKFKYHSLHFPPNTAPIQLGKHIAATAFISRVNFVIFRLFMAIEFVYKEVVLTVVEKHTQESSYLLLRVYLLPHPPNCL